jgi:hypothetical protein
MPIKPQQTKTHPGVRRGKVPRGQKVSYVTKAGVSKPLDGTPPFQIEKRPRTGKPRRTGHAKKHL